MLLFGAGRFLEGRRKSEAAAELPPSRAPRQEPILDDGLAEIEAILKKRGIT